MMRKICSKSFCLYFLNVGEWRHFLTEIIFYNVGTTNVGHLFYRKDTEPLYLISLYFLTTYVLLAARYVVVVRFHALSLLKVVS